MRPGELVDRVSSVLDVRKETVRVLYRNLRTAGLLSFTGKRGGGAADMTALDVVRVVIALLASDQLSEAAERVVKIGTLTVTQRAIKTDQPISVQEGTFESVLTQLVEKISDIRDHGAVPALVIRVRADSAWIVTPDFTLGFGALASPTGMSVDRSVNETHLWAITHTAAEPAADEAFIVNLAKELDLSPDRVRQSIENLKARGLLRLVDQGA